MLGRRGDSCSTRFGGCIRAERGRARGCARAGVHAQEYMPTRRPVTVSGSSHEHGRTGSEGGKSWERRRREGSIRGPLIATRAINSLHEAQPIDRRPYLCCGPVAPAGCHAPSTSVPQKAGKGAGCDGARPRHCGGQYRPMRAGWRGPRAHRHRTRAAPAVGERPHPLDTPSLSLTPPLSPPP